VPRESKTVLDLTEKDFRNISNVTGRVFEIGVHRSDGCLCTALGPNSEFLKQDLKGKHSWLNASSAKELSERIWHVLSACILDPLSTSVCVLIRQSMPIDMSLLKEFQCTYTDGAKRRSCPSVARGRLLADCAKSRAFAGLVSSLCCRQGLC
jgi:hypothetical protein